MFTCARVFMYVYMLIHIIDKPCNAVSAWTLVQIRQIFIHILHCRYFFFLCRGLTLCVCVLFILCCFVLSVLDFVF